MTSLDIRQFASAMRGVQLTNVSVQGALQKAVEGQFAAIVKAANAAIDAEAASAKDLLHADVLRAFRNGKRLANAMWGVRVHPNAGRAYEPAFEIRSSVPALVAAFSTGATIKAANGN